MRRDVPGRPFIWRHLGAGDAEHAVRDAADAVGGPRDCHSERRISAPSSAGRPDRMAVGDAVAASRLQCREAAFDLGELHDSRPSRWNSATAHSSRAGAGSRNQAMRPASSSSVKRWTLRARWPQAVARLWRGGLRGCEGSRVGPHESFVDAAGVVAECPPAVRRPARPGLRLGWRDRCARPAAATSRCCFVWLGMYRRAMCLPSILRRCSWVVLRSWMPPGGQGDPAHR